MKEHNKILLIGLPRCGSQYVSELITHNFNYVNIFEPFTENHQFTISYSGGFVYTPPAPKFLNLETQIEHTFSVLSELNNDNRVILKYFPHTYDNIIHNSDIVSRLLSMGFKPIILHRKNIEHHLISFLMSCCTNIWYSSDVNFKREQTELSDFSKLHWISDTYLEHYKIINTLDKHTPSIEYQTAEQDIKKIFMSDVLHKASSVKLGSINPYDDIINAEQVIPVVNKHVSIIEQIRHKYEKV